MLNMDYKILSKILHARLLPVLVSIIHPDQNGFLPRRSTFLNTCRLRHITDRMEGTVDFPVAMSLDIEKAFDTLGWDYLRSVLESVGLGPNCSRWI